MVLFIVDCFVASFLVFGFFIFDNACDCRLLVYGDMGLIVLWVESLRVYSFVLLFFYSFILFVGLFL